VTESWKRTQREEGGAEGEGGIYGRRESSEARAPAPSPIGRPLNPGGESPRLRLLFPYLGWSGISEGEEARPRSEEPRKATELSASTIHGASK
jgi:hypothetical protein